MSSPLHLQCPTCGAGLSWEQRYCFSCGGRSGSQPAEGAERAYLKSGGSADGFTFGGFGTRSLMAMALSLLLCGTIVGAAFSPPPVDSLAAGSAMTMAQAFPSGVTGGGTAGGPLLSGRPFAPNTLPGNSFPSTYDNSTYGSGYGSGGYSSSGTGSGSSSTPAAPPTPPSIGHVFVVMLPSADPADATVANLGKVTAATVGFSTARAAAAPTLASRGVLLSGFRQVAGNSAANGFALLSGQTPNSEFTANECSPMTSLAKGDVKVSNGLLSSTKAGCRLDVSIKLPTLADQIAGDGATFAVYSDVKSGTKTDDLCAPIADGDSLTGLQKDNPTSWFGSLRGSSCWDGSSGINRRVVKNGRSGLEHDLAGSDAPALSFIVPSRCVIAEPGVQCADGSTPGPAAMNSFVSRVFRTIRHSKTWEDSLTIFVWGSQESNPGSATNRNPASGAVLVSPFARAGTESTRTFNTFELLATIQDQLGMAAAGDEVLGRAKDAKYDLVVDSGKFRKLEPRPLGK